MVSDHSPRCERLVIHRTGAVLVVLALLVALRAAAAARRCVGQATIGAGALLLVPAWH
jgi:hypothetical protein